MRPAAPHLFADGFEGPGVFGEELARGARRKKLLWACGAGLPALASLALLFTDVFDLRDLVLGRAREEALSLALTAAQPHDAATQSHGAAAQGETAAQPAAAAARRKPALTSAGYPATCQVVFGYEKLGAGDACPPEAEVRDAAECWVAAQALLPGVTWDLSTGNGTRPDPSLPAFCSATPDGAGGWAARLNGERPPLLGTAAVGAEPVCRNVRELPRFKAAWAQAGATVRGRLQEHWNLSTAGQSFTSERRQSVGASIAVHPPKFYAVGHFLNEWAGCPAAMEALGIYLVFSSGRDLELFKRTQECMNPGLPHELWTPVVSMEPAGGWMHPGGAGNQMIAAYKKWHGVAHMMDLRTSGGGGGPEYGLLLDSELSLFHLHTRLGASVSAVEAAAAAGSKACGRGGAWSGLLGRIRDMDAAKAFPAARVSNTHTTYNFGGFTRSGKDFDRGIIEDNAHFVMRKTQQDLRSCTTAGCAEVSRQIQECLFSWWTDLPWVNLQVAEGMFSSLAAPREVIGEGGWQNLSRWVHFVRFEHIAYQQYCVLNEGFRFNDVTDLTGEAKWGSYLEDPMPGSRLAELAPMWVSSEALFSAQRGKVPPLLEDRPPLLIFHVDHNQGRAVPGLTDEKDLWEVLVLELLAAQNRTGEFNKDSIKL